MQKPTLLIIVDISGFTRFVAESNPEEGIARAKEMLEVILHSNDLGLELCEIEGDAVFFYLKKSFPSYTRLLNQIKLTFSAFQGYLSLHGLNEKLGIKFFVHAGNCQELTIGGKTKLFGIDVIKIHRLLKGLVNEKNYLLLTHEAADVVEFLPGPATGQDCVQYPHLGTISFYVLHKDTLSQPLEFEPLQYRNVLHSLIGNGQAMVTTAVRTFNRFALQLRNAAI